MRAPGSYSLFSSGSGVVSPGGSTSSLPAHAPVFQPQSRAPQYTGYGGYGAQGYAQAQEYNEREGIASDGRFASYGRGYGGTYVGYDPSDGGYYYSNPQFVDDSPPGYGGYGGYGHGAGPRGSHSHPHAIGSRGMGDHRGTVEPSGYSEPSRALDPSAAPWWQPQPANDGSLPPAQPKASSNPTSWAAKVAGTTSKPSDDILPIGHTFKFGVTPASPAREEPAHRDHEPSSLLPLFQPHGVPASAASVIAVSAPTATPVAPQATTPPRGTTTHVDVNSDGSATASNPMAPTPAVAADATVASDKPRAANVEAVVELPVVTLASERASKMTTVKRGPSANKWVPPAPTGPPAATASAVTTEKDAEKVAAPAPAPAKAAVKSLAAIVAESTSTPVEKGTPPAITTSTSSKSTASTGSGSGKPPVPASKAVPAASATSAVSNKPQPQSHDKGDDEPVKHVVTATTAVTAANTVAEPSVALPAPSDVPAAAATAVTAKGLKKLDRARAKSGSGNAPVSTPSTPLSVSDDSTSGTVAATAPPSGGIANPLVITPTSGAAVVLSSAKTTPTSSSGGATGTKATVTAESIPTPQPAPGVATVASASGPVSAPSKLHHNTGASDSKKHDPFRRRKGTDSTHTPHAAPTPAAAVADSDTGKSAKAPTVNTADSGVDVENSSLHVMEALGYLMAVVWRLPFGAQLYTWLLWLQLWHAHVGTLGIAIVALQQAMTLFIVGIGFLVAGVMSGEWTDEPQVTIAAPL